MDSTKYIGMDLHKETISIAVLNSAGKMVIESILETEAKATELMKSNQEPRKLGKPFRLGTEFKNLLSSGTLLNDDRRQKIAFVKDLVWQWNLL